MLCLILGLGAGLRLAHLGQRPLHFDEGTNARILSRQLESGHTAFNPAHHHGPLLSLMTAPIVQVRGEQGWKDLSKFSLRLGVSLCGILVLLASLFIVRGGQARYGGMAAAAFVATSPLLVYYSRMFIHEPLFVACGMVTLLALLRFLEQPGRWSSLLLGLGIGLMAATRETFVFSIAAWGLAAWPWLRQWHRDRSHRAMVAPLFYGCSLMLACIVLMYSDFLRNPGGVVDFVKTYVLYRPVEGHAKPFYYYFELLLWPKQSAGRWWSEGAVLLFALYGCFRGAVAPSPKIGRFLCCSGLFHLLIYSLIAYKTPWLASLAWLHICLAAGLGANLLLQQTQGYRRGVALAVLVAVLSWQGLQSYRAAFPFSSDARNPYSYVPTSKDVERMERWLGELLQSHPALNAEPVVVVGRFYWPLPWYLRAFDQVGYWDALPENASTRPLVLSLNDASALASTHYIFPRGLRFEVPVFVAIRNDIWEADMRSAQP